MEPRTLKPEEAALRQAIEAQLRRIWSRKGVPQAEQDELIADIARKVAPGAMVGPFKIKD